MFLKSIALINFKCHEHFTLDFHTSNPKNPIRKTTFITGENASGKSAVLQAIALLTGGSQALWLALQQPDDYIQAGKDFCELHGAITTATGEERNLSLRLNRGESRSRAIARARTTLAPMDAALRHTTRSYFTAGYGSGRQLDTRGTLAGHTGPSPNPRFTAVHSLFSPAALLRPLDDCLREAHQAGGEDAVAALVVALNTFLPREVRLLGIDEASGQAMFSTPDGTLPLRLLSNGYQQTVAWVSDLLFHLSRIFGNYRQPLSARGLLLIDEIDLHLHPAWQQELYNFLERGLPQFQVLATTTAPATLAPATGAEVCVLERKAPKEKKASEPMVLSLAQPRRAA